MKNRILVLSVCLASLACVLSAFQDPAGPIFRLIRSIPVEAKDLQTDRLGNLFVITKGNQLYKFSQDGKPLSTLNYTYKGNITTIDPANPLEVYVFYKELNQVLFLDNNLAYRGEISLSDHGIAQATAIARASDNGVWVFDAGDLQLKKMDKSGVLLQATGNVKQYVGRSFAPNYIYDNNDRVFVNDSATGILVFNIFGSYIKTIPIKGCVDFKIIEDDLFYNRGGHLVKYNTKTFTESDVKLPDTTYTQEISIEKERLYLLKTNSVEIYSY